MGRSRSEDPGTTYLVGVLSDHTKLAPRARPSFLTTRVRRGYRWGTTASEIGYHGGRVKVRRPRVRDRTGKEVSLESCRLRFWPKIQLGILA